MKNIIRHKGLIIILVVLIISFVSYLVIFGMSLVPNKNLGFFLARASRNIEKSIKILPACSLPYPFYDFDFVDQKDRKLLVGWGKVDSFENLSDGLSLIWVKKALGKREGLVVANNKVLVGFDKDYTRYFLFQKAKFKRVDSSDLFTDDLMGETDLSSLSVGDCLRYYLVPKNFDNKKIVGELVGIDFLGVARLIY